ncbi:hypothetical protein [Lacticaseibacillus mingshuiensis]|uniref:hypothetical protein n=1 Tax=Lacticaseibacillus mingshuiensis TaxID=2799574 RepID=UPI001CECCCB4|nr:hypothetical protein [Lacticaseibacillus mingshuiensis]
MLKVVKRPKEYIAIKVPDDCEDVGKFVSEQFKESNIPLKVTVRYDPDAVTMIGNEQRLVHTGDVIVDDYAFDYGHDVHAISQEEFDNTFMPANQDNQKITVTLDANTDPLKSKLKEISEGISGKIEGVTLSDDPKFSESFIAELDKALNYYHQKQARYQGVI